MAPMSWSCLHKKKEGRVALRPLPSIAVQFSGAKSYDYEALTLGDPSVSLQDAAHHLVVFPSAPGVGCYIKKFLDAFWCLVGLSPAGAILTLKWA